MVGKELTKIKSVDQKEGERYGEEGRMDDQGGRNPTRHWKGQGDYFWEPSVAPEAPGTSCEAHHAHEDPTRSRRVEEAACHGALPGNPPRALFGPSLKMTVWRRDDLWATAPMWSAR
jgi:hypothetical protein